MSPQVRTAVSARAGNMPGLGQKGQSLTQRVFAIVVRTPEVEIHVSQAQTEGKSP